MAETQQTFKYFAPKLQKFFFLFSKKVLLRGNRPQVIYFFTGDPAKALANGGTPLPAIPTGFIVVTSGRSGLPVLKKSG